MTVHTDSNRHWNIFARELATILASRGFRLGHLNDRAQIHPEKVRRLQRSLLEPKFHVLPPDELEHVCAVFGFSQIERIRLRAAVLCTAIEEMLMDRINQDDALTAAEQIFPILVRVLQAHSDEASGIGAVKHHKTPTHDISDVDVLLDPVLGILDSAILTLHWCIASPAGERRTQLAQQARQRFENTLLKLEHMDQAIRATQSWIVWHAEALRGLAFAERELSRE